MTPYLAIIASSEPVMYQINRVWINRVRPVFQNILKIILNHLYSIDPTRINDEVEEINTHHTKSSWSIKWFSAIEAITI